MMKMHASEFRDVLHLNAKTSQVRQALLSTGAKWMTKIKVILYNGKIEEGDLYFLKLDKHYVYYAVIEDCDGTTIYTLIPS